MAQNREIGELGQIIIVDTSANSLTVNGSIILGNSSSNVVINSTAVSFGGINQTDKSYTWTNTHTFTNTVSIAALSANGTLGLSSQVLTTNGTGIYWSSAGVNTAASYTWTNTHTFNANLTLGSGVGLSVGGTYGNSGDVLFSNGSAVYWAKDSSVQGAFPTGDYGNITGSQDAFGVNILTITSFECSFPGPVITTDLGTAGSI